MNFSFAHPLLLLLLPLAICFIYCKKHQKKIYIPKLEWITTSTTKIKSYALLKILFWVTATFALATPFVYDSAMPDEREGRAIVLALDSSGSMRESGFSESDRQKSKFELMSKLAKEFIDKRAMDNFGVVVFGSFAFSASSVTYDHDALKEIIDTLEVEMAGKNTAIGDALMQSIDTLSYSKAKSKAIILITDGIHNSGSHSPKEAIAKAKELGIKIYTIGLGSKKDYDKKLLDLMAEESGGESFGAENAKDLRGVYSKLDSLMPSRIRSENYLNQKSLVMPLLVLTFILLSLIVYKEESVA